MFFQGLQERARNRDNLPSAVVEGNKARFCEGNQGLSLCYTMEYAEPIPAELAHMGFYAEFIEHIALGLEIDRHVPHNDARPAIPKIYFTQTNRVKQVGPPCTHKGDDGIVPHVSAVIDVPWLKSHTVIEFVIRLFMQPDPRHE